MSAAGEGAPAGDASHAGPVASRDAHHEEGRRERWERRSEWPLTIASVIFLAAYAVPILVPDLGSAGRRLCYSATVFAWAVFVLDYVVRLGLARDRRHFVKHNLLDLAVIALPMLRPLRLLRLVTLLSVFNRHAGSRLRGQVAAYVIVATSLVVFLASLAVLDAERKAADGNIRTFGDAVWWAITTITTVGYGDFYPVSGEGRLVAVGLMVCGIALLGIVTASFASWLLDKVREIEEGSQSVTKRDLDLLHTEVAHLHNHLKATLPTKERSGPAGPPPDPVAESH